MPKKILIVEDEKPLSHALELKLTHEGFEVIVISNGEDFAKVFTKEKPSLIICDLVMPKVDGFEILRILKQKKSKTPVIVLTNLSQAEDEKIVRELWAVEFFVKSNTSIAQVVETLKKTLKIS